MHAHLCLRLWNDTNCVRGLYPVLTLMMLSSLGIVNTLFLTWVWRWNASVDVKDHRPTVWSLM